MTFDFVASLAHVKMKYYNIYDEIVIIYVDLLVSRHIHKYLQYSQDTTSAEQKKD